MALYTTAKDSHFLLSQSLSQTLKYLSETAAMTLFSIRNLKVGSSQTTFNPDNKPIADTVQLTMRSSTIGSNSVDLLFFYDPYDWSFPPDLIIQGNLVKPSLQDIGLDDSWDQSDPANLSTVLSKLSRMMQARTETLVLFAVPFTVPYTEGGKNRRLKIVVKVQYLISTLMGEVTDCKSNLETLSSFEHPQLIESISPIARGEHIVDYIDRITKKVKDHFERLERLSQMKKEFIEAITKIFRENLIEYDGEHYKQASFLLNVPKDSSRPDAVSTAIVTFHLTESFPEEPPKMALSSSLMPFDTFTATPKPELLRIERYSPRWSVDQMIAVIWEQLWEEIPRFHSRAVKASSNN
ncbi:hypothetical protein BGZ83_001637 [Gryganskiella cystojenkinii]|nr:hypothetical protein BGZ83_001637 [Gryganskiella cystojenkinii]